MKETMYITDAEKLDCDVEFELCCYNGGTYSTLQDAISRGGLYEINSTSEGRSFGYDMADAARLAAKCLGCGELEIVYKIEKR